MSNKQKRPVVILAAGGTGGHLFPAQALAEALWKNQVTPFLVYDERVEELRKGIFQKIECHKVRSYQVNGPLPNKVKSLYHILFGIFKLRSYFKKVKPAAVVGFGGYASFSTIAAAISLDIKIFLHEQNSILGKANRLFQFFASSIFTSFPHTQKINLKYKNKTINVGWLVRSQINSARTKEKVLPKKLKILVIGGSQGARIFSEVVPEAIKRLPTKIQEKLVIIQQARKELVQSTTLSYESATCRYVVAPFFQDIAEQMACADIVICRAGSSTIGEVIALGKASILIPFPYATDNHQMFNAKELANKEAAILIDEREFNPETLSSQLLALFEDRKTLKRISENAAKMAYTEGIKECVRTIIRGFKQ